MKIIRVIKCFKLKKDILNYKQSDLDNCISKAINEVKGIDKVFNVEYNILYHGDDIVRNQTTLRVIFFVVLSENINNKAFRKLNKY